MNAPSTSQKMPVKNSGKVRPQDPRLCFCPHDKGFLHYISRAAFPNERDRREVAEGYLTDFQ